MIDVHKACRIPWHPKHKWGAVDKNGNYCRFIDKPHIAYGECWIGSGILAPQVADVICQVGLFGADRWEDSLHECHMTHPK